MKNYYSTERVKKALFYISVSKDNFTLYIFSLSPQEKKNHVLSIVPTYFAC